MGTNDLKNIWKSKVNEEVKPYSLLELDNMIVKNVRNSIPRLFPGLKIKAVLSVLVIAYLLWQITTGEINLSLKIFYSILTAIVFLSWMLLWRSLRKMQRQNTAIPLKEWIKSKIADIDKSIAYQKKYDAIVSVGLTLFIIGILVIQDYIINGTIFLFTFILALVAVFITLYLSHFRKKRFKEVRNYLQSLYKQLTENNLEP